MNTLTSLLFCNERYNACTIENLQNLQDFTVLCFLYESVTVHDKIHNKNLLLNLSSVLYSEVNGPERSLQF